ncbi:MAG: hypothetical protein NT075_04120 [Chloroflexi bacterium]|nr:hypothetical protein [Chloroflexota bacterium]
MMQSGAETTIAAHWGVWVGFVFSLLIFSALAGENAMTRLAQHILVGASLGYLAILVLRDVLQPRLLTPLFRVGATAGALQLQLWAPLILGLFLCAAGLDRMLQSGKPGTDEASLGRRFLHGLGMIPVALLLGVSIAVGLVGVWQGTLLPQIGRMVSPGIAWSAAPGPLLTSILTLLLTTATLLHLSVRLERKLTNQPAVMRSLLAGWIWLGKRALWVAAGVIFARLVAARLSLLIGRMEFFLFSLNQTGIWRWAESLWRSLVQ